MEYLLSYDEQFLTPPVQSFECFLMIKYYGTYTSVNPGLSFSKSNKQYLNMMHRDEIGVYGSKLKKMVRAHDKEATFLAATLCFSKKRKNPR